jgi:hypothetical protein
MRRSAYFLTGLMILAAFLGCRALSVPFQTSTAPPQATSAALSTATAIPASPGSKIPALSGDWQITLLETGGIMGLSRSVEIKSSGEMTLSNVRTNKTSQILLPADKLSELTRLVSATRYRPVRMETGCADCFIFNLQISSNGQSFQVQLNQLDLDTAGLLPLIDFFSPYLTSIE